ncbi:MAG: rRNA cytosine-C5-methyltransferase [Bacteroidaceae bacterium]|nr:rRNA cytosine-C5-methyltransferase [Bacteroidaceae bacterium]
MLPPAFTSRLASTLGPAEAGALCAALDDTPAVVSLRLNPAKPAVQPADGWTPVPWCEGGYILPARPDFTADPLLHAGCYYVQEAASMAIALAYDAMDTKPARLLDLCAAPGGKSTLWRTLLADDALLVANEPVGQRAMVLRENLQKWGHPATVVTEDFPARFAPLAGFFDAVAADVPCSGEGMFRKDRAARDEWSEQAAAMCARRQREIVSDVWPALRGGGYLVYSTCTFNPAENEDNVRWICETLGANVIPLHADAAWGVDDTDGLLRFRPHRSPGEGFFLALLRKTGDQPAWTPKRAPRASKKSGRTANVLTSPAPLPPWLAEPSRFVGLNDDPDGLCALPHHLLPEATALRAALHVIATGTAVATVKGGKNYIKEKGGKLIPAHALALSTALAPDAFPCVELPLSDALQYLSRQTIALPPDTPRGHVLTTYQSQPLGFLNNLGSRANNLYPPAWRIRRQL